MASEIPPDGDPLVDTLPPATDYMTYLTLLEYQLTPQNLPTLTRLLSDDDGTLAKEIGWDLLKIILRFLSDTPDEANRCLEIIARRGNPREVVVRVAEELEKLGDGEDDEVNEGNSDQGDDEDELPTFAGEAPRVHLGAMTLDGMPPTKPKSTDNSVDQVNVDTPVIPSPARRALKLQSLFNMLSILHSRIKTQYPSRFLATSLPAALGAYRHVPITAATTLSFLAVLEQLAGKSRPPLPPRVSDISVPTVSTSSGQTQTPSATTATLPDPEAKIEEAEKGVNLPSAEERAIISRLLYAVLLEVLDEYLSSLSDDQFPSMSWTSRLRESLEPKKSVPGRETETQLFEDSPKTQERESVLSKVKKISLDLGCDISAEIKKLIHEDTVEEGFDEETEEEPSEYPTSPSQIPLPRNGVIFLYAYQSYLEAATTSNAATFSPSIAAVAQLIDHSSPLSATPAIPSAALLDSLLSLLYRQALANSQEEAQSVTPPDGTVLSPAKFLLLISTLTQLFAITPWASLRDSAYQIASKLIHAYPKPEVRLQIIAQTIEGSTLSSNWAEFEEDPHPEPGIDEETGLTRSTSALEPHPIPLAPPQQLGVLKAVGVDWLKDEILRYLRHQRQPQGQTTDASLFSPQTGLNPDLITDEVHEAGIRGNESSLLDLLFPKDLTSLDQAFNTRTSKTEEEENDNDDTISAFLLNIPFYISTLNLLSIILPNPQSASSASAAPSQIFTDRASAHVSSLGASLDFLTTVLLHAAADTGSSSGGDASAVLAESRADINALQDAYERVRVLLQ
ncbi:hypothetical protein LTR84_005298 [Exophiala bonariae]|uniref:DUF1760-domain-containing protein n=1 Tax=Exophiala bonariae TaxID=1690606 RepID=A0AAV9N3G6_9EURO|nr:hypothetical protein LTR84_005298 [Exophiala bonariae]